jgi:hypothetical protein
MVDMPHRVVRGDGHPANGVQHFGECDDSVMMRMA